MTIAIIVASVAASVSAVLITWFICSSKYARTELICQTIIEGFETINVRVKNEVEVGRKGETNGEDKP
ncbi:MAG TPA: hypothetical protein P5244_14990 [Syntrophales bacterium]|nr:hypothetical protein [Syntrophales bacterium]